MTQSAQPSSQNVGMGYWEKDCSSTVTISVHTVENEPPLLHNVIANAVSSGSKNIFNTDESSREKLEPAVSRTETTTSNFITATSDFSTISNLTPQSCESVSVGPISTIPIVQNLSTVGIVSEDSSVESGDAVMTMNQDSSSQSSLNLENEESEIITTTITTTTTMTMTTSASMTTTSISTTSTATTTVTVVATVIPLTTDTTRKLQAFQAKCFESDDSKCLDKSDEKVPVSSTIGIEEGIGHSMKNGETIKSNSEYMDSNEMTCNESRLNENLLQTDIEMKSDVLASNVENIIEERISNDSQEGETTIFEDINEENLRCSKNENMKTMFIESQSIEKDNVVTSNECVSAVIVSSSDALYRAEKTEIHSKGTVATISFKENFIHDQSMNQEPENMEVINKDLEVVPKIISFKNNDKEQGTQDPESNMDNLKREVTNGNTQAIVESMVLDSINVVQKPKEMTSIIEKIDSILPIIEMTENADNVNQSSSKNNKLISIQDESLINIQGNKATECITIKGNQSSVIENIPCRKEHELMEVDDEETLSTFQQDEEMEHETMEELPES
jgi:hypothetical protein